MKVSISLLLNAPAQQVLSHLLTPALLQYVSKPLMTFEPIEPLQLPSQWQAGSAYKVNLRLGGWIPMGYQIIDVSGQQVTENYELRDNGHGLLVKRWDHRISLKPDSASSCWYTDSVEIEAGLLTPVVWLFAKIFYRHRQRRWQQLIEQQFSYAA